MRFPNDVQTKIYFQLLYLAQKELFPAPIPSNFNLIEAYVENRQSDEK